MARTLIVSTRAAVRLEQARAWLRARPASEPLTVIAHTVDAAAEIVRSLGRAMFGWERTTLFRLAVKLARPRLLEERRVLASNLALEALWARVVHERHAAQQLGRYAPLASKPGLVRALARTAQEVRLGEVSLDALEPSLAGAIGAFEDALDRHRLADRAMVYRWAVEAARPQSMPLALIDVQLEHHAERALVRWLVATASEVLAVAPQHDPSAVRALESALAVTATSRPDPVGVPLPAPANEPEPEPAPGTVPVPIPVPANVPANVPVNVGVTSSPLGSLQSHLFSATRDTADTVRGDHRWDDLLSAPGEAREAVELVRVVRAEARKGVPFDQMAVLLRAPGAYRSALEAAFRRAEIPAYFARGTPRPDPSGRALLALLKCAEEGLSARRFSEYVSLGQVPDAAETGAPPPAPSREARYVAPDGDEVLLAAEESLKEHPLPAELDVELDVEAPVVAGALRSPRRWEALLVDAAVIGVDANRWRRRLAGLRARKEKEAAAPDLTEAQQARIARDLGDLSALEAFALPLLDELTALPRRASWGEWLEKLSVLAARTLKFPQRVQSILQELAPMAVVGPVELREVRTVLSPRLSEVTEAPQHRRAGQVYVGPIDASRGLAFEVVLVPGLVERVFPQKLREDPLLPDAVREKVELATNAERIAAERLALQLSTGAARRRVVLSYPRIDAEHARPRVPSFYALEAIRAVEGRLPGFAELQRRAETAVQARLGWPAPRDPRQAIDETEFDLSLLDDIFRGTQPARARARYLIDANPHLARALRARFAKWTQSKWTAWDGLVNPPPLAAKALEPHQYAARAFSPTALQHYAACPYRFFLSAIQRLAPLEIPEVIEQLGPLEKGSLTHEVLFRLMSQLRDEGLTVTEASLEGPGGVFARLNELLQVVADHFRDEFAPAIDRIWLDGLEAIRADLRELLRRVARNPEWQPWRFELSFGLSTQREQRDPSSVTTPVRLDNGLQVRGSIDLVEKSVRGTLRATDYKTGKARAKAGSVVGGGYHLQPLLYALVLEKLLPEHPVEAGRLYYCTQAGGFSDVTMPLDDFARATMAQVVDAIGDSLTYGFFPAAPAEGECRFCDFRAVCGPDEERRVMKKNQRPLDTLQAMRRLP